MALRSKYNPRNKFNGKPRAKAAAEQGYVLLVFTLFAVFMVVAVYSILPKYVFEGQRQKEDELIFRGQQYVRAIQLFVRKNGRYPLSLDELQSTNGVRFIRQLYPDPMSKDGEWRLIHVAPGPVFYDALNPPAQPANATGGIQSNRGAFQIGGGNGNQNSNSANSNGNNTGNSGGGTGNNSGNGSNGSGIFGSSGIGGSSFGGSTLGWNSGSQNGSNPQTVGSGGAIAGVASKSEKDAIKVFNGFQHYNEWEFIFNYATDAIAAGKMNAAAGPAPANNGANPAPGGNGGVLGNNGANPGPSGNGLGNGITGAGGNGFGNGFGSGAGGAGSPPRTPNDPH